ncbi:hypothetical protein KsCSTR_47230 [Candidatus Kuenenia stuttgartiensis]|uniref:Uncharacterized protein n=1 Tax=Kuenenia stuttgartiensis TaxID=174633 RepID=A0A6G7GWW1_KUEST|nr:hypothetical protein KsCSTR_47230 [Candidatus Kuenenia stuttgartiensis]
MCHITKEAHAKTKGQISKSHLSQVHLNTFSVSICVYLCPIAWQ